MQRLWFPAVIKKRGLGDSKYNERRSECEKALAELQKVVSIDALGDLTEAQFEEHKDAIKEEVCVRRAKHAVYENQRTIKAVEALKIMMLPYLENWWMNPTFLSAMIMK